MVIIKLQSIILNTAKETDYNFKQVWKIILFSGILFLFLINEDFPNYDLTVLFPLDYMLQL
jgi:hypothetical protein